MVNLDEVSTEQRSGTIVMGHNSLVQFPQVDWDEAYEAALARCAKWGYSSVVKSPAYSSKCSQSVDDGCVQYSVQQTYKCVR